MSAYFKLIYFVAYFTHLILNVHFYRRNNFVPVIGAVENLFNVESNVIRFKVKKYLARVTFLLQNCHKFSKRKIWFDSWKPIAAIGDRFFTYSPEFQLRCSKGLFQVSLLPA